MDNNVPKYSIVFPYSTIRYSNTRYSTIMYLPYSTIRYFPYSTIRHFPYSTIRYFPYSTIRYFPYSTIRYSNTGNSTITYFPYSTIRYFPYSTIRYSNTGNSTITYFPYSTIRYANTGNSTIRPLLHQIVSAKKVLKLWSQMNMAKKWRAVTGKKSKKRPTRKPDRGFSIRAGSAASLATSASASMMTSASIMTSVVASSQPAEVIEIYDENGRRVLGKRVSSSEVTETQM